MNVLDMRGIQCPIPVVRAKKELERPECSGVIVIVDNEIAVQNLKKMADGKGHSFSAVPEDGGIFRATILKGGSRPTETVPERPAERSDAGRNGPEAPGITVLVSADSLGTGSEDLGKILIKGFLFSLGELDNPITTIIFINGGVRLVVNGSNTIDDLRGMAERGTKILACGTCLNYYGLTESLAVGEIADMYAIAGILVGPGKLVSL
ncbi:MAG: sulfurtransferase-like selenium metabolism protein YedF [Treponema sp.]|nr:sulfurtransferase-like selenium metabolism protein YedF [Treponema sp.]